MTKADLAAKIANDIAEGIDCGETRKQLREAVSWWANVANEEARFRSQSDFKLNLIRIAFDQATVCDKFTLKKQGAK